MKLHSLVLPFFAALAGNCLTASADFIILQTYTEGLVETYPYPNSEQWQTSPTVWGSYAASTSGIDGGPPAGFHTADASATLSRTLNSFSISGAVSVFAGSDLFGLNIDNAVSSNYILFSTSIPIEFLLTLTESEQGLAGVRRFSDNQVVLSPGIPATLAPGTYDFFGMAQVAVLKAGESASQNFSATLSFAAVPEPSASIPIAICAACFSARRKRRC